MGWSRKGGDNDSSWEAISGDNTELQVMELDKKGRWGLEPSKEGMVSRWK